MLNKIIIILIITLTCFGELNTDIYYQIQRDAVRRIIESTRTGNVERKLDATMFYADFYGHSPILLARLIFAESSYNENAINSSGAKGLMQIMPIHQLSAPYDIDQNIDCGAKLLRQYWEKNRCYIKALYIYAGFDNSPREDRLEYYSKVIGRVH